MKTIRIKPGLLAAATIPFLMGCPKSKNLAPELDTETESSVYTSFANYVISDIEMACSFMGENAYNTTFYHDYPGSASGNTGTVTVVRDNTGTMMPVNGVLLPHDQLVMAWNNTRCLDGNFRGKGSIFMYVPQLDMNGQPTNNRYCRDHGFQGRISLTNYKVNGWLIELYDPNAPAYLYNTLESPSYSNASTKLTWRFAGKFKFTHPTDPNKNMIWEGELFKTLDNTSNPQVFAASHQSAITWSLAVVSYYGKVNGSVPQIDKEGKVTPNVPFSLTIDKRTPLIRDFQCSAERVSGVAFAAAGGITQHKDEHHPFREGTATLKVGDYYPRQIYYGNEGTQDLAPQCDEVGVVLIKGVTYAVNFQK